MMLLTAHFTSAGVPATGLAPIIDVWNSGGTKVVDSQLMTEVAGGFYIYDFASYDETVDYFIRADGGSGLTDSDRYVVSSNEVGQVTAQLSLQDNTLQLILGLVQSNFRMTGHIYDVNGNLTAATITIYPTAADVDAETNALASYTVSATYDVGGKVTDYQVTKD